MMLPGQVTVDGTIMSPVPRRMLASPFEKPDQRHPAEPAGASTPPPRQGMGTVFGRRRS